MAFTYSLPPDNILPDLIGAFVEIRREFGSENQGIIGAIKARTREQLKQTLCNISVKKREEELKKIIHDAKILEQEITQLIKQNITEEDANNAGLMSWIVGNGDNMKNIYFQKLITLYRLRYGENEAQKVIDIFSDAENNGKYKLYIEYGDAIDRSGIFIRRLWLEEIKIEQ